MRKTAMVLGVPVDDVTMTETVDDIARLVDEGRRNDTWHQVATVNLDFLTNAVREPRLRDVLQRATLSVPDGMPVIWAARMLGSGLRTRVAGADLVDALAHRAVEERWRIHLFGAGPGVAEDAAVLLTDRHPGATVTGQGGPVFRTVEEMDPAVAEDIRLERPDIVCVALGNPKQEWWIQHFGPQLGVPVLIGVGGTLDFLVGRRRRAPRWMQRAGLEWVFRALQEPARLGPRYALDAWVCGPRLVAEIARRARHRRRVATAPVELSEARDRAWLVRLRGPVDAAGDPLLSAWTVERGDDVTIDVGALSSPDRRTLESLVAIARAVGAPPALLGATSELRRALRELGGVDEMFRWPAPT